MNNSEEKIHVLPLATDWEIETESGTPIAHEEEKSDAIAVACEVARSEGAEAVIVHHEDGITESVDPLKKSPDKT